MSMKSYIISIALLLVPASVHAGGGVDSLSLNDSLTYFSRSPGGNVYTEMPAVQGRYDRRVHRYRKYWLALIPTQTIVQYAGNMGLLSAGVGWDYGKRRQWETNLLFGYLPKFHSGRSKLTMTLKENYIPWSMYMKKGWQLEPLSCGLYMNTVFGDQFWGRQPQRYPHKYYEFLSTEMRVNIFVGQRITKIVPLNRRKFVKSVTAFYEVSACDIYIRAMIQDRNVGLSDILSLSLGVKFQLL